MPGVGRRGGVARPRRGLGRSGLRLTWWRRVLLTYTAQSDTPGMASCTGSGTVTCRRMRKRWQPQHLPGEYAGRVARRCCACLLRMNGGAGCQDENNTLSHGRRVNGTASGTPGMARDGCTGAGKQGAQAKEDTGMNTQQARTRRHVPCVPDTTGRGGGLAVDGAAESLDVAESLDDRACG